MDNSVVGQFAHARDLLDLDTIAMSRALSQAQLDLGSHQGQARLVRKWQKSAKACAIARIAKGSSTDSQAIMWSKSSALAHKFPAET